MKIWTDAGLSALGGLALKAREARNMPRRTVKELVEKLSRGEFTISEDTLRTFELGLKAPSHNLVYAIAACGYVINPKTKIPFSGDEFSDIASEVLDPLTGEYFNLTPPNYSAWGNALSLSILVQQHCLYLESLVKARAFDTMLNQFSMDSGLDEDYIRKLMAVKPIKASEQAIAQLSRLLLKSDGVNLWTVEALTWLQDIQSRDSFAKRNASIIPQTIKSLVSHWMARNARRWVLERCSELCEVEVEALESILNGNRPEDLDLERLVGHLMKPDGTLWTLEELERLRQSKFDSPSIKAKAADGQGKRTPKAAATGKKKVGAKKTK